METIAKHVERAMMIAHEKIRENGIDSMIIEDAKDKRSEEGTSSEAE